MDRDDLDIIVAAILTTQKPETRGSGRAVDGFKSTLKELRDRGGSRGILAEVDPTRGSIYDQKS